MSRSRDATTDESLLQATPDDPDAFAAFYRRHENVMLVFFLRRVRNAEVAADLTAEVFAGALAAAPRFKCGEQPAVAWLYGIAHHKLVDSIRKGRVEEQARRNLRMEPIVLTDAAIEAIESLAEVDRGSRIIEELLGSLPPEHREAIQMRIVEERGYDEIAAELRCSSAVVRQRVSRGLRRMRVQLTKEAP